MGVETAGLLGLAGLQFSSRFREGWTVSTGQTPNQCYLCIKVFPSLIFFFFKDSCYVADLEGLPPPPPSLLLRVPGLLGPAYLVSGFDTFFFGLGYCSCLSTWVSA